MKKKRTPPKQIVEPWSMLELNRLVMASRTMPGFVGEISAKHWFPALILLILDLDITAEFALSIPANAFQPATGRIARGHFLYQLHSVTTEAFKCLPPDRESLLPWPKDSTLLWRDFKTVLYRAGLPYTRQNSFSRLQATTQSKHDVMDHIQPIIGFVCNDGKPHLIRARDLRRHALPKNKQTIAQINMAGEFSETHNPGSKSRAAGKCIVAKAVELSDDPKTLLNVFRSKYRPVRLRQAAETTAADYERTIALAYSFAGKELTFADLTDAFAEEFVSDCFERGAKPATCNKFLACLLLLWRFGWKRRLTDDQPRDVQALQVDRELPDAWTTNELGRIIAVASQLTGHICDIPAATWWPSFLLVLYDSGLRIQALLSRKTTDLNEDGWLTIDAANQKQRKAQTFKLHSDTLRFVRAMEPADRLHLFPWPYVTDSVIRDRYRAILEAAGLPTSKRDLFHKLRRTSATALCVATDENTARDHLGHSNVSVTRRYLDHRQIQPVAAADIIARPDVGPERG